MSHNALADGASTLPKFSSDVRHAAIREGIPGAAHATVAGAKGDDQPMILAKSGKR